MKYTIKAANGNSREADTRADAESIKNDMEELGLECEIIAPGETSTDVDVEEVDPVEDGGTVEPVDTDDLPDRGANIDEDPLTWMPGHFVDDIQGTPAINRKGYAVLAAHYNIGVTAEPVVRASESDFEYAEFQATAITRDGVKYSGFGSAHVDRMDGDDQYLLNELAETRACKRALALATGVGVVSAEEMRGEL